MLIIREAKHVRGQGPYGKYLPVYLRFSFIVTLNMPSNVFKHKQPKDTGKSQGCLHVLFHHLISIICFPIKNETVIQKMTSYKPPESFLLKKANILEPSTLLSSVPQHLQGAPDTGRIYSTKVYEAAAKGHLTTY